jgi:carbonic anhydrase
LRENLIEWLHAFQAPHQAVQEEVAAIIRSPFTPQSLAVHGMVYDLASGRLDIVVNG